MLLLPCPAAAGEELILLDCVSWFVSLLPDHGKMITGIVVKLSEWISLGTEIVLIYVGPKSTSLSQKM